MLIGLCLRHDPTVNPRVVIRPCEQAFKDKAPAMFDYLLNEFHRFAGESVDSGLDWDGFWRFVVDLDLGLDDAEIASLRGAADVNHDGFVDW